MTKLPNFFIIGAPKCGTTSLYYYLRTHPNVFLTTPKEPDYFSRSLTPEWKLRQRPAYRQELSAYLKLYDGAKPKHVARGEASTRTLRCVAALQEIRSVVPDARLIAMVRNPVLLAQSWHAQKVAEHKEPVLDFEQAWRLEPARRRGEQLPARLSEVDALRYSEVAALGSQLERLFEIFPRQQVHVIVLDDMAANPRQCYQDVLRFLGLPDDGRAEFPTVNPRKRNPWARVLALFGGQEPNLPKISPAFDGELREYFAPEVLKLETILSRKFSSWK
jgi:hypothetical protein